MTSDGLPEREMAACLAAGAHPNLTGALGRLADHPEGLQGLLMPLLPADWRVLAGPPSLETCSRDVYDPALRSISDVALRIARDVATGAAHLHAKGLSHGDLYAHNTLWDGRSGRRRCSATSAGPRSCPAAPEIGWNAWTSWPGVCCWANCSSVATPLRRSRPISSTCTAGARPPNRQIVRPWPKRPTF
jgi:hypothetical protein